MTRFKKEMLKRYPALSYESFDGSCGGYVIASDALVVFDSNVMTTVLRILPSGADEDVTIEYPEISAPYLVHLCGGDREEAKRILREDSLAWRF